MSLDIETSLSQTVSQLQHTNHLYKMALDASSEAVVITDTSQKIIFVNQAFLNITLYSQEDVIGSNTSILQSGWHDDKFYTQMWSSLKREGFWEGKIWNRRKDGQLYPQWLVIHALKNESGKLENYVGTFRDLSSCQSEKDNIEYLAHYDYLTEIPNRHLFLKYLQRKISLSERESKKFALMFIDIDDFKRINDTLGHPVGDHLLKSITKRFNKILRSSDMLSRLGGDEFTLIVEEFTSKQDVIMLVEKIYKEFLEPFEIKKNELKVGFSIGISIYPDDADDLNRLIEYADRAMYHAKSIGKNRHVVFNEM